MYKLFWICYTARQVFMLMAAKLPVHPHKTAVCMTSLAEFGLNVEQQDGNIQSVYRA